MTMPAPYPITARAYTAAVIGVEGHLIQVQATATNGPPCLHLTGLPDTVIRETRDRVNAAVVNSGQTWPARTITVSLLPASLPKRGTGSDLAIAIAALTAAGAVPAAAPDRCVFYSELGLDGSLRPVRGVPALLSAAGAGCTRAVVAAQNSAEAVMVPGLAVAGCQSLGAVLAWLRGERFPQQPAISVTSIEPSSGIPPAISLAIPPYLRQALEVSAAGGHHLCLTGGRGTHIPALAASVATLMPTLTPREAMEVTAIHSTAGLLESGHALITRPPLRAPHHTTTPAAMLGGGNGITRPGEAALAHRGVLFLDQAPEFARNVLQALRQPLQHREITVSRSGSTRPVPRQVHPRRRHVPMSLRRAPDCTCAPLQARRYRSRLVGQLGSHIAIWLNPRSIDPAAPADEEDDPDAVSATRVAVARDRARHWLRDTPWDLNADIPGAELRRSHLPPAEALAPISRAVDLGEISTRSAHQIVRVAWTLADLAGNGRPGPDECGQALAFHLRVAG